MKRTTARLSLVSFMVVAGLHLAGAAPSAAPAAPLVTDVVGDANGVNAQGLIVPAEIGQDTRPASIPSADFVAISFETLYETVRDRDAAGAITGVRYIPHSLRVVIETAAPARPTSGPTHWFRVPATVDNCGIGFEAYVRGTSPGSADVEEARLVSNECPGGTFTEGITLEFEGNLTKLTYPFDKTGDRVQLGDGVTAWTRPTVRTLVPGTMVGAPVIDETPALSAWVVGQDVPGNVDCAETPGNPDCLEP